MPTRPLVTRYEQDLQRFPDRWHRVGLVAWAVGLALVPVLADARWLSVASQAAVAVVGAVALMILTGFAGQVSLGHAAFLALGAYTVAVLGERVHLPFWLGLPAAGLVSAGVGLAVGPFALRLKGLYLALVTLGLLFLVTHLLYGLEPLTHGSAGIAVPMHTGFQGGGALGAFSEPLTIGPVALAFEHKLYLLYLALALGAVTVCHNVQRSRLGRAMVAVRESELAAAALGISPARIKVIAFVLSSFLAGVAGAMFAWQQQYLTIVPPFDLGMSVAYVAMLVLGGIGTTFGAVAGALAWVVLAPVLEEGGALVPLLADLPSSMRASVLFSLAACAFLAFEPLGLLGWWLRVKRYFQAWPFRY